MQLIGHEKQWQFFKKSFELGKISHAYLFCGEEGVGKMTVAKEFIKLLQCQGAFGEGPCQKCFSCLQIEKACLPAGRGFHPDLTLIAPGEGEIQISQIRDLCWTLSLKPYAALYKAAIIDEAEKMNSEAANALLKTLEEPSGHAVLILISSHPEMLPRTIVSRAQIIKFFPLPKLEIENYLKNQKLPEEKIKEIILVSEGKPGRVLNFLTNPSKLEEEKKKLKEFIQISHSDLSSRFQYVKKITENEENLGAILENWLRHFRNLLILHITSGEKEMDIHPFLKLQKIIKTIETINFLVSSTNVNPRLALEMVMLEL